MKNLSFRFATTIRQRFDRLRPQNDVARDSREPQEPSPFGSPFGSSLRATILALVVILFVVPLTIWLGMNLLDDRRYYFTSMLIILESMIPFALVFESRRPKVRELVLIAVLCVIGVVGRMAFFMVPHFKPLIAIVIIAGVALGGEVGFLVGAVTIFVSNMFFGQGPWTPWQMFALGSIGFLAGALFHKRIIKPGRVALCVFGGLVTLLIYGPIINTSAILTYQINPTIEMFYLALLQGFPLDLVHSAATVIFLYLISRPLLDKLDRIKVKHGIR